MFFSPPSPACQPRRDCAWKQGSPLEAVVCHDRFGRREMGRHTRATPSLLARPHKRRGTALWRFSHRPHAGADPCTLHSWFVLSLMIPISQSHLSPPPPPHLVLSRALFLKPRIFIFFKLAFDWQLFNLTLLKHIHERISLIESEATCAFHRIHICSQHTTEFTHQGSVDDEDEFDSAPGHMVTDKCQRLGLEKSIPHSAHVEFGRETLNPTEKVIRLRE